MNITKTQLEKMVKQDEMLIRVSTSNEVIGSVEKIAAHRFPGIQHRAITCFLIDQQGKLLLTKRSKYKPLWPLFWDAACSSHQWFPNETAVEASERRLPFELGIHSSDVSNLTELFVYDYRAVFSTEWVEHEFNYSVFGILHGEVHPNSAEVAESRWLSFDAVDEAINNKSLPFAPWFSIGWHQTKEAIHKLQQETFKS